MSSIWHPADTLRDGEVSMIYDDSAVACGREPPVPAGPRPPNNERPAVWAWQTRAHALIERLVAESRVWITDPDGGEVAECRCVGNHAKRHGLETRGIARLGLVRFAGLVSDVSSCPLCGKRSRKAEQARCWVIMWLSRPMRTERDRACPNIIAHPFRTGAAGLPD